ncbi:MAG: xylose isomerase [Planctomycetes bacterium SCN 63-9]|nr:MAG: xylose isomerase [Planctomycetes bacterium SCN 63-9]
MLNSVGNPNRRSFLKQTLAAGALAGSGIRIAGAAEISGQPKEGPIGNFKISLAEWSLHRALFSKKLTNLDFPRVAREDYGIEAVEFVNQFFKDKAHDSDYLRELKKRANDVGVACVLIMIDGEGDLSSKEKAVRLKAVENHKKWVDAAVSLGCHAIRINTGKTYSPTDLSELAEACTSLVEYADAHKIHVICENHGGASSDPNSLVALIKAVGKPGFGTLPDFGNFPRTPDKKSYTIDVYDAIARLMPYAKGVSAKSHDFNPDGQESELDYARILKIVTDAGYNGYVGIEYEGGRLSEPEGIRATKKLIESVSGTIYKPKA